MTVKVSIQDSYIYNLDSDAWVKLVEQQESLESEGQHDAESLDELYQVKQEQEKRLSYFYGSDWNAPTARQICKELDEIDAQIAAIKSKYNS